MISHNVLVNLNVFMLQEFVTETIEVKVEEFEALKGNAVPLKQKYPPSDWLERKMKEICDQWDELWSCCDKHRKHLGKVLVKYFIKC